MSSLSTVLALNDFELSKHIIKNLPNETYSSVEVRPCKYDFKGNQPQVDARQITLCLKTSEFVTTFFRALFAGLGMYDQEDYKKDLIQHNVKIQLLGLMTADDKKKEVKGDQIVAAYRQAKKIVLYISKDAQDAYVELQDGGGVIVAYTTGKVISVTFGILAQLLMVVAQGGMLLNKK